MNIKKKSYTEVWNNNKNSDLFEKLPITYFEKTSKDIGLNNCCDVNLLSDYIAKASSILDVGAGWGRVLNYLIDKGFKGQLYAIERSQQFFSHLNNEFSKQVKLIKGDLREENLAIKVNLILWMWAGIAEFTQQEQLQVFLKLASILDKGGYLILETSAISNKIPKQSNLKMVTRADNYSVVEERNSKISYYYYMPSAEQLEKYAKVASLKNMISMPYKTDTNVARILYIFEK